MAGERGRLYVGTSGFSYPAWVPRFYAPGKASRKLLAAYATRLPAVELHNTFLRRPNEQQIDEVVARDRPRVPLLPQGAALDLLARLAEPDPAASIRWLTDALEGFGERLGCVLLSLRGTFERDDEALERVLSAWPTEVPLALELLHPSWHDGEVRERARSHGVTLVATDLEGRHEPELHDGGVLTYLRLRREAYDVADLDRWLARLAPFMAHGRDAFVFFRHDEDGSMALNAETLLERLGDVTGP